MDSENIGLAFLCLGLVGILCIPSISVATHNLPISQWQCTKQQRVGDTLPAEYECVQYTKGDEQ